ncbi:cytochrome P450 [Amycolatopsis orientalis]|uniref:cytochrome P450 n=1 Tax=Amycolatopsis orientalis TaxID=31958 RepID=UPI00056B0671|nr:cytochrome P450 [Amycolatopsis orientalis]
MTRAAIFDPTDPAFLRDRYPVYRRLRDEAPVLRTELGGRPCVILTRYADVDRLLRDERARVRSDEGVPEHLGTGPAAAFYRNSLPCLDPPEHTRLRKLIAPAFTPRTVHAMRSWLTELVDAQLAELAGRGEVDFVADVAAVLPARIACRLLHAPDSDAGELLRHVPALNAVLGQGGLTPEARTAADEAARFYFDYFTDVVGTLRGTLPEDDLVGALVAAADSDGGLGHAAVVTALTGLLMASYHTTRVALAAAVFALLEHPGQLAALRADPGLATNAWDETLRYDAPIHFLWRDLAIPLTFAGERLEAGTHVVLGLAAANRDERRFADPDRFDLARADRRHLAFAAGAHYCPGAPLSRLEGEIFLPRFFARFPDAQVTRQPERQLDLTFAELRSLHLDLGRAA